MTSLDYFNRPVLFFDCSDGLELGLWENSKWLEWISDSQTKTSEIFHQRVVSLLRKFKLKLSTLEFFVGLVGPGSYTGIRQSALFADYLRAEGKSCTTLSYFELFDLYPDKTLFAANAFKKELLIYCDAQKKLIKHSDSHLLEELKGQYPHFFCLRYPGIECFHHGQHPVSYLKSHPEILEQILNKQLKTQPVYFRSLEKEFGVAKDL